MRAFVALAALSLLTLAAPAGAQSAASTGLREEITGRLQALITAANAGDADAFFALAVWRFRLSD